MAQVLQTKEHGHAEDNLVSSTGWLYLEGWPAPSLCRLVLSCIVLYCIVLYSIILYYIVMYCIWLYNFVLYSILLFCNILDCIVLFCIVWIKVYLVMTKWIRVNFWNFSICDAIFQMFLDTMEPRTENKNSSLEKNCFDNVSSDMWNNCLNCP